MIVGLFAGPGGWSEGARSVGAREIGIEKDAAACATRRAAGHLAVRADVEHYPTAPFAGAVGVIASPPCPDFSVAGNGAGIEGESGRLIVEVLRWVGDLRPEWVACEQVPPALRYWKAFAHQFEAWGYSTWTGEVNAADFGVPQTRKRAILLASRVRQVCSPEPTHARSPMTLFGELGQWVTMAEALGWGATERPYVTIAGGTQGGPCYDFTGGSGARRSLHRERDEGRWIDRPWPWSFPATTIAGDPRITARCHHDEGSQGKNAKTTEQVRAGEYEGTEPIRLTLAEASTLQGFRPDYPWQGTKTEKHIQIGNAVPPPLASAVLRCVVTDQIAPVGSRPLGAEVVTPAATQRDQTRGDERL